MATQGNCGMTSTIHMVGSSSMVVGLPYIRYPAMPRRKISSRIHGSLQEMILQTDLLERQQQILHCLGLTSRQMSRLIPELGSYNPDSLPYVRTTWNMTTPAPRRPLLGHLGWTLTSRLWATSLLRKASGLGVNDVVIVGMAGLDPPS